MAEVEIFVQLAHSFFNSRPQTQGLLILRDAGQALPWQTQQLHVDLQHFSVACVKLVQTRS